MGICQNSWYFSRHPFTAGYFEKQDTKDFIALRPNSFYSRPGILQILAEIPKSGTG
jgi:hypothetical protein